jgi:hypothetical protein
MKVMEWMREADTQLATAFEKHLARTKGADAIT